MKIAITVARNEIVSRGRQICRLASTRHSSSWRRAPAGTWLCTQVEGARSPDGMQYTLTLERFDIEQLQASLAKEADAERVAATRYPFTDWSCLAGFTVTQPERRSRPEEPRLPLSEPIVVITRTEDAADADS